MHDVLVGSLCSTPCACVFFCGCLLLFWVLHTHTYTLTLSTHLLYTHYFYFHSPQYHAVVRAGGASAGSLPHPSRASRLQVVESLRRAQMVVAINGVQCDEIESMLKDSRVKDNYEQLLCDSLSLKQVDFGQPERNVPQVDFSLLASQGETEFQKGQLTNKLINFPASNALDLSNQSECGPFFKYGQLIGVANAYLQTARPDAISKVAPMDLDINKYNHLGFEKHYHLTTQRSHNKYKDISYTTHIIWFFSFSSARSVLFMFQFRF
jgi:hypothetical protein